MYLYICIQNSLSYNHKNDISNLFILSGPTLTNFQSMCKLLSWQKFRGFLKKEKQPLTVLCKKVFSNFDI